MPGASPVETLALVRVTSADIAAALRDRYRAPECAIAFEVAQGTGLDARRHVDAVAMELWPSRGLAIHGIEIKVTRNDWRREKANPEKAEEIARFCDFFWIAAPKDVVPQDELPSAWGLLEFDFKARGPKLKAAVKAVRTEARTVDRKFLAAIFRAATRPADPEVLDAALRERRRELEEKFSDKLAAEVSRLSSRQDADAVNWRRLLSFLDEAAGATLSAGHDPELFRAIVAVYRAGAVHSWNGLNAIARVLDDAAARVRDGMEKLQIDPDIPYAKAKRKATG